jgi:hypothetical protein
VIKSRQLLSKRKSQSEMIISGLLVWVPVKCEMKRETKYTETERNEMKRNEIYQNEAKRNEAKRNEMK